MDAVDSAASGGSKHSFRLETFADEQSVQRQGHRISLWSQSALCSLSWEVDGEKVRNSDKEAEMMKDGSEYILSVTLWPHVLPRRKGKRRRKKKKPCVGQFTLNFPQESLQKSQLLTSLEHLTLHLSDFFLSNFPTCLFSLSHSYPDSFIPFLLSCLYHLPYIILFPLVIVQTGNE